MKAEEATGFCGGFCGKCPICGVMLDLKLWALQEFLKAADFRGMGGAIGWPMMRDNATDVCGQFEERAESFCKIAPKLFPKVCRTGCVPCDIAKCCKEKAFFTCAECADMMVLQTRQAQRQWFEGPRGNPGRGRRELGETAVGRSDPGESGQ